jgi:hypothetical protein
MRMMTLVCAGALSLSAAGAAIAFDAAALDDSIAPSRASTAEMKANNAPPARSPSSAPDPGVRSAKSIECSQKADAQDLHGKPRKHFIHDCKRGI